MDQIFNKVGSYWLGQKANKQFDSVGNDLNVRLFLTHPIESDSSVFLIDFDLLTWFRYNQPPLS